MRHFSIFVLAAFVAVSASAESKAYVWANEPTSPRYTPAAAYAYNSAGGPITITRLTVGLYSVAFGQLGATAKGGGNVQVTSYGGGAVTCGVRNWVTSGADLNVNVRCYAPGGAPADSQFTLLATWPPDAPPMKILTPAVIMPPSASAQPAPPSGDPSPRPKRSVRNDGAVVLTYPDGTTKEFFVGKCGYTIRAPGRPPMSVQCSTQVQPNTIPPPPTPDEKAWLDNHAKELLDIIRTELGSDEEVTRYLQSIEGAPPTIYDSIAKRRATILALLAP